MRKVTICSKIKKEEIRRAILRNGFDVVSETPDFILSYGGDGTVLFAERKFPSIPKLVVKDLTTSKIRRKYEVGSNRLEEALEKVKAGKYELVEEMKLEASFKGQKITALNEIQIHNKLAVRAIRFSLSVDGRSFEKLIGDGVIVATPFGSTAYYQSVGGKPFKRGIGIAFNNLHERKIKSFVVPEDSQIVVKIKRDCAQLLADNWEKFTELRPGDKVEIRKSGEKARFILIH